MTWRAEPTGRRRPGYTLLELVVVLAILALAVAVATPLFAGPTPLRAETAARELAEQVRATRRQAMARHGAVALDLRRFLAARPAMSVRPPALTFYPDGSASQDRLDLRIGAERAAVRIDWLTGAVRVE